jgi:hypothetical protein
MDEIKIRNINKGAYAIKKELEIKEALMSSPKKIMIDLKIGGYLCVFPIFGSMSEISLDSDWRYTDELTEGFLFFGQYVKYTIIFRIRSVQTEEIEQYMQHIVEILQYRWVNIVLDYSDGNNCKKIHMKGRFQKIAQKFSNFYNGITIELEFSADEPCIKIEKNSHDK